MNANDTPRGIIVEASYLLVTVVCSYFLDTATAANEDREFYKPPSPCLTGPSCRHCVDTIRFYHQQVCCFHCRLDNVVINHDICHCIDTRLPDSRQDVGGNCSSGQICQNCAVQISTDESEGVEATPGIPNFCCQDCGLVMPYLYRDEKGCHCEGLSQGKTHQTVPRYDPSKHSTTTALPLSSSSWSFLSVTRRPLWCPGLWSRLKTAATTYLMAVLAWI